MSPSVSVMTSQVLVCLLFMALYCLYSFVSVIFCIANRMYDVWCLNLHSQRLVDTAIFTVSIFVNGKLKILWTDFLGRQSCCIVKTEVSLNVNVSLHSVYCVLHQVVRNHYCFSWNHSRLDEFRESSLNFVFLRKCCITPCPRKTKPNVLVCYNSKRLLTNFHHIQRRALAINA